jgi:ubiquinone/menaquinone biosynthesis C-methylase UbiE
MLETAAEGERASAASFHDSRALAHVESSRSYEGVTAMSGIPPWRRFWEENGRLNVSDYQLDRGTSPRTTELESLSDQERLEFIEASARDVVFDAGCGTGANEVLLHSRVRRIVGMDYSESGLARCKRRISLHRISNVDLLRGDLVTIPLPHHCVDRILCMSVLQFLSDDEARAALAEFARILKPGGVLILHVKNISSVYLSTLWALKRFLLLLGKPVKLEYFRSHRWYVRELRAAGFDVLDYNSFNLFMLEGMPRSLLRCLQRFELRYHKHFPLRTGFMRRHGSELKLKACAREATNQEHKTIPSSHDSSVGG